jgi:hypothetical protein
MGTRMDTAATPASASTSVGPVALNPDYLIETWDRQIVITRFPGGF